MTTYRTIAATETDPEAPVAAQLMKALASNPVAMFEGASGAPRLEMPALQTLVAGDTVRARNPNTLTQAGPGAGNPAVTIDAATFGFLQSGVVRVAFEHNAPSSHSASIVRVDTSGGETALQTWAGSGGWTARSLDCTVARGESLIVRHVVASGIVSGSVRSIEYRTNGQWLWPGIGTAGVWLQ